MEMPLQMSSLYLRFTPVPLSKRVLLVQAIRKFPILGSDAFLTARSLWGRCHSRVECSRQDGRLFRWCWGSRRAPGRWHTPGMTCQIHWYPQSRSGSDQAALPQMYKSWNATPKGCRKLHFPMVLKCRKQGKSKYNKCIRATSCLCQKRVPGATPSVTFDMFLCMFILDNSCPFLSIPCWYPNPNLG